MDLNEIWDEWSTAKLVTRRVFLISGPSS